MNEFHESLDTYAATACSPGAGVALMERQAFPAAVDAEARLRRAERERDALRSQVFHLERLAQAGVVAGGLAHDARNLLTAISGTCQLAIADDRTRAAETFEHVQQIAERAARAMEVFLAFVRRGGDPGATCRVQDVVADAARFLAPVLSKSRVTLVHRVDQGLRVRGEATLLLQALVNLVSNAVRAIDGISGRVEIVATAHGRDCTIDVVDDGPGVPDEVRLHLFEPFVTTHGGRGGTGLGLHTSRQILEQHGGSLVLAESRPGRTVFRLRLPLLPLANASVPVVPASELVR